MFRLTTSNLRRLADAKPQLSELAKISNLRTAYNSANKVHNKINDIIAKSDKDVVVFMKGQPKEPKCSYSGVVVQILEAYGVDYNSCDVMEDPDMRKEIKTYSDWPTIPQVYKDGRFIGGCDILLQMHQTGELKQLFGTGPKSEK